MKDDSLNRLGFTIMISSLPVTISLLNLLVEEELEEELEEGAPDSPQHMHYHAGFEIQGVTQGECRLSIDGTDYMVREGEMCLIPPSTYHVQRYNSKPFSKYSLIFELSEPPGDAHDTEGARVYSVLQEFHRSKPFIISSPSRLHYLFSIMRDTARDRNRLLAARSTLHTLAQLCILETAQYLSSQLAAGRGHAASLLGSQTRNALIEGFFGQDFNLGNGASLLAQRLNISRRQLDRILLKTYGKSYREMLMEARLEVALDLLRTSDKNVAEISEVLGYSTPANFSTFIKHQTGLTPTELRKAPPDR